jgi:hypothetical protein
VVGISSGPLTMIVLSDIQTVLIVWHWFVFHFIRSDFIVNIYTNGLEANLHNLLANLHGKFFI